MADRVMPGPVNKEAVIREAVSINTRKIFDSCRDKDCIDDLRVFPTVTSQNYIENAISIRPRRAELLYCAVNVEPISFNRGYYTVDCSYFYRVTGETFPGGLTVQGLAVFDKRVMLFGSEGSAVSFVSNDPNPQVAGEDLPVAVLTAVDPIALQMKVVDAELQPGEKETVVVPAFIADAFPEPLLLTDVGRRWLVTLGQFSIPAYNYSMPEKDCPGSTPDDPCELFSRIQFPMEEFFPPDTVPKGTEYRSMV